MTSHVRELGVRSPYDKVGDLLYFGRMLDKIRSHAKGELPLEYQVNPQERDCSSGLKAC
jgi:hypothetical protein